MINTSSSLSLKNHLKHAVFKNLQAVLTIKKNNLLAKLPQTIPTTASFLTRHGSQYSFLKCCRSMVIPIITIIFKFWICKEAKTASHRHWWQKTRCLFTNLFICNSTSFINSSVSNFTSSGRHFWSVTKTSWRLK